MVRKSDVVRSLVAQKQYKQALRIAKDFRLGITAEQSLRMKKAYECMVHERFYLSLGEDIEARIAEGIETIISIYGKESLNDGKVIYKQIQQQRIGNGQVYSGRSCPEYAEVSGEVQNIR